MILIDDDDDKIHKPTARGIGLGNFDGIHLGHRKLVEALVSQCRTLGLRSMIYTFWNHPGKTLEGADVQLLTTMEKKMEILESLGLEELCLRSFDRKFANMDPRVFISDRLVGRYGMKLAVTGFNYRFGREGSGERSLLEKMGKELDFTVLTIPPVTCKGVVISSTAIREHIKNGDMEITAGMLGRFHSIRGKVEYGNRIGIEIGFPTANIMPINQFALPPSGVYFTRTTVDGTRYDSITNIGVKPTVQNRRDPVIETHLFRFQGWLYGKEIDVYFLKRLRDEKRFSNTDELKKQILRDIRSAEEYFLNKPFPDDCCDR